MGKGCRARPILNYDKYSENWNRIFKKGKKDEKTNSYNITNVNLHNG